MFITLLISGLCLGGVYGLVALGYSLIYKTSGLMNFAMGDILTLGAFVGWTFSSVIGLPFFVSMVLTMIVMFIFGYLLEKTIIRKILNRTNNPIFIVLATIAISYILRNSSQFIWGTTQKNYPNIINNFDGILIGNYKLQIEPIVCIIFSALSMFLLHFFMTKTRFGTAMRASALDSVAAESCGIDVSLTTGITWGISSAIAAAGGILIGPLYGVYTTLGANIGKKCFASAVIGGYGNMYGSIIGGFLMGILETFISGYLSSTYKNMFTYLVLLLFLFIKPTGIFNEKTIQE